jgi:mRNA-degrading endonuclease RelE of RelBE toxin-antitoxin system
MARGRARIELAPRAIRDVGQLERPVRERMQRALEALSEHASNLDVKPVTGRSPWRRLRVGEHRILFRQLAPSEAPPGYLVARVIDRRDLLRAIDTL